MYISLPHRPLDHGGQKDKEKGLAPILKERVKKWVSIP